MTQKGDGYRIFYDDNGKVIRREDDVHVLFRLCWFASPSDLNAEVNTGVDRLTSKPLEAHATSHQSNLSWPVTVIFSGTS